MPRRKLDRPNYRLRARGGIWYVDWTDTVSGHSRSVSTRQTERRQAEIWRDQWIAGREQPIPPSQATIAEIMQAYTAARLPHVESKETLRLCAKMITNLIGNLQPCMSTRSTYTTARSVRPVSAGSMRRELTVLRAAFRGQSVSNGSTVLPMSKCLPNLPRGTDGSVERMLIGSRKRPCSPHIRLFILLGYHTAARTGAILDLTWDRVDLENKLIFYNRAGRRETKKRRATVPLNTPALAALQEARAVAVSDYVIEYHGRQVPRSRRHSGELARGLGSRIARRMSFGTPRLPTWSRPACRLPKLRGCSAIARRRSNGYMRNGRQII